MEKLKLKHNQEVIYFDGVNLVDKTFVIETNKEQGIAKLANGITVQIESTKRGYFKRAGIRSDAKAWLASEDNDGTKMYKAYIAKSMIKNLIPNLSKELNNKSIHVGTDQAWLNEMYKTLNFL